MWKHENFFDYETDNNEKYKEQIKNDAMHLTSPMQIFYLSELSSFPGMYTC
jgi:hypothetical protein